MAMKLNLSYPQHGSQKLIELDDDKKSRLFFDRRIAEEVPGDALGDDWKGYILKITGGNDKQGFAMKQGVLLNHRTRLLLDGSSTGFHPWKRPGHRKRKSVRGCIIGPDIAVINAIIIKKGEQDLPGLTDPNSVRPSLRGPKRASHIRKLWGLSKQDDVRQFVSRKKLPKDRKNGKPRYVSPKIQRLITPVLLHRKKHRLAIKKQRREKSKKEASDYASLLANIRREKRKALIDKRRALSERKSERVSGRTSERVETETKAKQTKEKPKAEKAEKAKPEKVKAEKTKTEKSKKTKKEEQPEGKTAKKPKKETKPAEEPKGKGQKQTSKTEVKKEQPAAKPAEKAQPAKQTSKTEVKKEQPATKPAQKTAQKPAEKTAAEKPAAEKPAQKPAAQKAPAEKPAAEKPAQKPAAQKAPAEKPAAEKPAQKPAAEKPAPEKPAQKPAAEKAPAEKPPAQKPAEKAPAEKPAQKPAEKAPAEKPASKPA
jgi:small subunit ribosomal protein S6e